VEESTAIEHLPEEYVTDVVLSLRKRTICQNSVLTVEVQKATVRGNAKGEHPFEIRDRNGTLTGSWENADAPITRNAYVKVFPSLAHRYHLVSADWARGDFKTGKEIVQRYLYLSALHDAPESIKSASMRAGSS
jgi:hypothetical protein